MNWFSRFYAALWRGWKSGSYMWRYGNAGLYQALKSGLADYRDTRRWQRFLRNNGLKKR